MILTVCARRAGGVQLGGGTHRTLHITKDGHDAYLPSFHLGMAPEPCLKPGKVFDVVQNGLQGIHAVLVIWWHVRCPRVFSAVSWWWFDAPVVSLWCFQRCPGVSISQF